MERRYGALRTLRSRTSRADACDFEPPPGSQLVAEISESTEGAIPIRDLHKPENEALIPFLAAIEPDAI
jgi:hypothetical protein